MAKLDQPKINRAIQVCLRRCYKNPGKLLPAIEHFLDGLRASGVWSHAELREVELGIRRVLVFGVLDSARYPRDSTDKTASVTPLDDSSTVKINGA